MIRLAFLLFLVMIVYISVPAQRNADPYFDMYSVSINRVKVKSPKLASHKDARLFRTRLNQAAKDGVNFAGRFVLTRWGCGATCSVGAIIESRSSAVYFPKELSGFSGSLEFQPNSQLLVIDGEIGNNSSNNPRQNGKHYLRWTGAGFKKVRFVERIWN